ncbi:peptide chain release factor 2 [Legionella sp. km772]|uniref:peptide chain release factor 2 n=1 Tax=Legionella sp. km772 TaxID=2498111 RepID=UPI000F8F1800|nr:peptide chain release factor 2 [Legionella sp. km772]RUR13059.1 peptide chain release factor 2 [Legionella sp. km772]
MLEVNQINLSLTDLDKRIASLRGYLDFDSKSERLEEVTRELESSSIWENPELAQALGRERTQLEAIVHNLTQLQQAIVDLTELFELAREESDEQTINEISEELKSIEQQVAGLEFRRMFSGKMDTCNAYLDIQSGSGGTEAQDWAEMILRMFLRWGEQHGFQTELIECSPGEVAGIKSATIHFVGEYAFGWLRTETGVHRLVRKSPFDSGNRRHTSFAAVFVSPEIDDDIEIEINPADLRIDTYRASGAGGQHVNRTDSAVRITHMPSGIVVQCQNDRSQHKNKDQAMKQLRAKLYELEMQKKNAEQQALEASKSDIGWGSQIRSYVLDQSRVKDLRTGVETSNTQAVLDGALDQFIEASLKAGVGVE